MKVRTLKNKKNLNLKGAFTMKENTINVELTPDELEKATIVLGAYNTLFNDDTIKDAYRKLRRALVQSDN